MSLTHSLSSHFSRTVRHRGENYANLHRVEILKGGEALVEAQVTGSQAYFVSLDLEDTVLLANCDCPYAEGGEACKHIWATLMIAERRGYLHTVTSNVSFRLAADDDFTGSDEEDREPSGPLAPVRSSGQSGGAAAGAQLKPVAKPPEWRTPFSTLRQLATAHATKAAEPWPASREILYVLDIQASTVGQAAEIVLEILVREPKKNGEWGKPRGLKLALNQVAYLPDPRDTDVMTRLVGARDISYYSYGYGGEHVATRYQIPRMICQPLMPLLCSTGRCFFRLSRNSELSGPLSWDSGPAWDLRLQVEADAARRKYLITGHLQRGEEKLALGEPLLIHRSGLIATSQQLSTLASGQPFEWVEVLRAQARHSSPDGPGRRSAGRIEPSGAAPPNGCSS